jgi:hypothetical protein
LRKGEKRAAQTKSGSERPLHKTGKLTYPWPDPSGDKNPELRKAAAMSEAPTLFLTAGGFLAFSSCKKHDSNDDGERPTRYIALVKRDLEAEPRT